MPTSWLVSSRVPELLDPNKRVALKQKLERQALGGTEEFRCRCSLARSAHTNTIFQDEHLVVACCCESFGRAVLESALRGVDHLEIEVERQLLI